MRNQHPILNLCTKFELKWLINENVMVKPYFRWNKWAEIRNDVMFRHVFDVTIFYCFEKLLADILFLPSFIVVRHQMGKLKRGGVLFVSPFPL